MIVRKFKSILLFVAGLAMSHCGFAQQPFYEVSAGDGNGIRFWQSDSYKIHMGNTSEYHFGPVTDYSIKVNMENIAGRGWTWGIVGQTPIAALNNQGHMQVAKSFFLGPIFSLNNSAVGRLSVSGPTAELSLMNRTLNSFIEQPSQGERWVIYNEGAANDGKLKFWSGGDKIAFTKEGYVGIGTISPRGKFDVDGAGDIYLNDDPINGAGQSLFLPGHIYISPHTNAGDISFIQARRSDNSGTTALRIRTYNNGSLTESMHIAGDGNIGIGSNNPDYKLTVNGIIHSKEVKIDLSVPGPDYVFANNYPLPSLNEIKAYIDQHKHLPEVPSAKEMEANGVNVGEMNMILLKKVEELTLHLIEQSSKIEMQQKQNENLKKEIAELKTRISK